MSNREENIKRFRSFFAGEEGEFVLKQIDELCGYEVSTFDPDPYIHSYKAGQRSAAIAIHVILGRTENERKKEREV